MVKAYIAGPMRGYPNYNFDAFDEAALELDSQGVIPISPADMDRFYEGWDTYPPEGVVFTSVDCIRFIRRDLDALLNLDPAYGDFIYLLRGWADSSGARVEKALADFLGLPCVYQP